MLCCGAATTMLDLNRAGIEQYNTPLQSSAEHHVCSTACSSSFILRLPRQRSCEGLKLQDSLSQWPRSRTTPNMRLSIATPEQAQTPTWADSTGRQAWLMPLPL